ncbi:lipopolysaccharide transport periplasmic protein LptA [Motiliproteus sp. SC1-56]|uniref:lipopolysaccharide transport periplasmic protein LptA n=1 Tax=Motiliproteus sp. SC1-56 TaxID=2799565 RepID=UPI001A8FF8B2|nr:lipopolysaccharide transport periplasmic protein LptA [Motiliproteus sp. SC1-56]
MTPNKLLLSALALSALALPPMAQALPDDREQPIQIAADSAELDDQKGVATYRGAVKVTQGSLMIEGETVIIYAENGEVSRLVAEGQPAHFQQRPSAQAPLDKGYANHIDYSLTRDHITLEGEARLERDRDRFSGQRIELDMQSDLVSAFGGGEKAGDQRVRMILQPKQDGAR